MNWLKKLFSSNKCYFCGQKAKGGHYYLGDEGNTIAVCYKCLSYAERRAFRKKLK